MFYIVLYSFILQYIIYAQCIYVYIYEFLIQRIAGSHETFFCFSSCYGMKLGSWPSPGDRGLISFSVD